MCIRDRLTALVNRDNALVVDLRAISDFEKGHIAGAKNVQMSQFDPEHKSLAPAKACLLYTSRCV